MGLGSIAVQRITISTSIESILAESVSSAVTISIPFLSCVMEPAFPLTILTPSS